MDLTTLHIQIFLKGVIAGTVNIAMGLAACGDRPSIALAAPALVVGMLSYGAIIAL